MPGFWGTGYWGVHPILISLNVKGIVGFFGRNPDAPITMTQRGARTPPERASYPRGLRSKAFTVMRICAQKVTP